MKRILRTMIAVTLLTSTACAEEGWTSLFDGKSLDGWIQKNGEATYRVKDGAIVGTTKKGSPNSFLCTTTEYGDFELEFEVKLIDNELNSGCQIRSQTHPARGKQKFGRVNGPQIEIEACGKNGAEAGYIYGEACGGWMTPQETRIPRKAFKDGEWNAYRIVANGPRIQTWVNGEAIEDLTDTAKFTSHPKGFIGLQVHGVRKGQGPYKVAWRNIRVKTLATSPLSLWYTQPAANWNEALPIGNGQLGAMVFGGRQRERLQLNVDTLWDGYPMDVSNPESLKALPEIRRLMFEGKNKASLDLAGKTMMGNPRRIKSYQTLGNVYIDFPGHANATTYRRALDLNTALSTVTYASHGTVFNREIFSSAPANCLVLRLTADKPESITLRLNMDRQDGITSATHPTDPSAIILAGRVRRKDTTGATRGVGFGALIKVMTDGGTVSNKEGALTVTTANAALAGSDLDSRL